MITWALNVSGDQQAMRARLVKQKFPLGAIREVVWAYHPGPEDSAVPLHPPVNLKGGLALINSRRFSVKKAEELWRTLWGMSSDAYFADDDLDPPPRPNEQISNVNSWFFPYPTLCFAREAGAPKCVGSGSAPFFPRTWHPPLLYEDTYGTWVCRGCFDHYADPGDRAIMERYLRGDAEIAVLLRSTRRYERLSAIHGN